MATGGYRALFGPSSQLFGPFPSRGSNERKLIALTFDDGPNEPYTSRLLQILDERAVSATFFQVGECVRRWPGLTAEMAAAGHVIGNHTYRHRFSSYLTSPSLRLEISRAQDILTAELDVPPALFRPPWLCHPPPLMTEVARQGLRMVSGTFAHPLEVLQIPADRIAARAVRVAGPGTILILHDGFDARGGDRRCSVAAVAPIIDRLRAKGYEFTTVDRLLGIAAYRGPTSTDVRHDVHSS